MKAAAYIRYSIMGAKVRIFFELYYLLQYFSDIGVSHEVGYSIHCRLDREDDAGDIILQRVIQA
jgi:hypothetical protein